MGAGRPASRVAERAARERRSHRRAGGRLRQTGPRPWARRRHGPRVVARRLQDRVRVDPRRLAPAVGGRSARRHTGSSARDSGPRVGACLVAGRPATRVRARVGRGHRPLAARPRRLVDAHAHPRPCSRLAPRLVAARRTDRVRACERRANLDPGRRRRRQARAPARAGGRPRRPGLGEHATGARSAARRAAPRPSTSALRPSSSSSGRGDRLASASPRPRRIAGAVRS